MKQIEGSRRGEVYGYVKEKYGAEPEYLWFRYPGYAVFRHSDNEKWFGIVMDISAEKLGLKSGGMVDILELKSSPLMSGSLEMLEGVLPAYHMKKGAWITVLLDGTLGMEQISQLIDMSFELTAAKKKRLPRNWLVPANPKYYDVEGEIARSSGEFIWKQGSSVQKGDTVYLYIAAPVSAIRYKCEAVETDIPYEHSGSVNMKKVMRLRLLEKYDRTPISFDMLKRFGVNAVRGPRSIPQKLINEIDRLYRI